MSAINVHSLALGLIAASGTALGGLLIVMFPTLNFKQLGILAGLAAGLMLGMTFFDLVPETLETLPHSISYLCFFIGVGFFSIVTYAIPEKKLEELVMDGVVPSYKTDKEKETYKKILTSGLFTAVGIALHNFPEGLALFLAAKKSKSLGLSLTVAMTLHNIPEGVAVALPIYFATKSKMQAFKLATISGLAEPLAVVIATLLFPSGISQQWVDIMLAGVAGIMCLLAFYELLPMALKHVGFDLAISCVFVGMAVMALLLVIMDAALGGH